MIRITANTRELTLEETEVITVGSMGILCKFTFSDDWEGLSRTAIFKAGEDGTQVDVYVEEEGLAAVPPEILTEENEGEPLMVGVYGDNSATIAVPTLWVSAGAIRPGAVALQRGSMT